MKRGIYTVFILLFCFSSYGQKIRFCDSSNSWRFQDICFGCDPPPVLYSIAYSDCHYTASYTLFGHVYQLIYPFTFYCREDTVTGKVYIRYRSGTHVDTNEFVLYDNNWRVGDTVGATVDGFPTLCWVYLLDSTQINGIWYKVWHFTGDADYNVIEGLGCTNGLDYPMSPYPPFEFSSQLICFSNRYGSYPLSNPVSSWGLLGDLYFDNFYTCTPSLGIDKTISQDVGLSPNPLTPETKITFSKPIKSGTLTIANILGQHVVDFSFANRSELPIGDLITVKGFYFYHITDNQSGKIFSGKFQY